MMAAAGLASSSANRQRVQPMVEAAKHGTLWGNSGANWATLCVIVGVVVIMREALRLDTLPSTRPSVIREVRPALLRADGGSNDSRAGFKNNRPEPVATPASSQPQTGGVTTRISTTHFSEQVQRFTSATTLDVMPRTTSAANTMQLTTAIKADTVDTMRTSMPGHGPCSDNRVVARTGAWSRSGQRLGNTLCMLGRALREAEDAGGGVLELLPPGSRYYNTTTFCVSPSAESAGRKPPDKILEGTFSCYTPCTCGGGRFDRFRNVLQRCVCVCVCVCANCHDHGSSA